MKLRSATFAMLAVLKSLTAMRLAERGDRDAVNALYGVVFRVGVIAGSAAGSAAFQSRLVSALPLVSAAIAAGAMVPGRLDDQAPTGSRTPDDE